MIGDVNKALHVFWNSFGIPAYLSGHVPDASEMPYITYGVANEDAFGTAVLVAYDWHRKIIGVDTDAERAVIMDMIAEAIPPQGHRIALERGYIIMYRNSAGFQTYYDDPEDKSVIGGRTSVECRYQTI